MKKLFIVLILIILPLQILAVDILKIKLEKDLVGICPSGKIAVACLDYSINTIYLRNDLDFLVLRFALSHEIGHWIMRDVSYEQYHKVFGIGTPHELEEIAANKFNEYLWYSFGLTQKEKTFFNDLMLKTDLVLQLDMR